MENREIKFRAWDVGGQKMLNNCLRLTGSSIEQWVQLRKARKVIWMQYTGLKDKNGKEAYEKDLIISTDCITGHIEYSEVHAAFIVHTYNDDPAGEWLHNYEFEIIGNIYEDKDLLE